MVIENTEGLSVLCVGYVIMFYADPYLLNDYVGPNVG